MELSERIQTLLDYSRLSIPKFSVFVGFKTPQTVRELLKGNTKSISDSVKYKISAAYPELNMDWLVNGDGEMLTKKDGTNIVHQHIKENNGHNAGRDMTITTTCTEETRLILNELAAQRQILERRDNQLDKFQAQIDEFIKLNKEQFDRFMSVIESITNK